MSDNSESTDGHLKDMIDSITLIEEFNNLQLKHEKCTTNLNFIRKILSCFKC